MTENIVHTSGKEPLSKISMMIFTLGPILAWYKIPFVLPLGHALIFFFSIYAFSFY